jgi:Ca2+-binding RTX toxin-like protein
MRVKNTRPSLCLERLDDRIVPTVTAVGPSSDFRIFIDAGETVEIGRTDNFKLRVTADGFDLPVQQAASSIQKLTIVATGDFANTIDLRGINPADFVSLTQISVSAGGGHDRVFGSAFGEVIAGADGNDLIQGGAGNDTLHGQIGNDILHGQVGNDLMYGGVGNDVMYGGVGNDKLYGHAGNDRLYGQTGNDQIFAGPGLDTISGGPGFDTVVREPFDILLDL